MLQTCWRWFWRLIEAGFEKDVADATEVSEGSILSNEEGERQGSASSSIVRSSRPRPTRNRHPSQAPKAMWYLEWVLNCIVSYLSMPSCSTSRHLSEKTIVPEVLAQCALAQALGAHGLSTDVCGTGTGEINQA